MLWPGGAEATPRLEDCYRFGPGLVISIRGDRRARAHFRSEYSSAGVVGGSAIPLLEASIGAHVHRDGLVWTTHALELRGAHKLARWRASVPLTSDPNTIRVAVDVHGPLGLTLVQSYIVEPLVSLAAVRAGSVLLPSAAIARGGAALLLLGRSRSGKSSLAARALAAGLRILGDDQVLIDPDGQCLPFPRRLRLYPDLARTAPAAFAALPSSARGELTVLGGVRSLTRGFVAPPLRVSASTVGTGCGACSLPIGEVIVIRRAPVDVLSFENLEPSELRAEVHDTLLGQRSKLFRQTALGDVFSALLAKEQAIISRALAAAPARRVLVPNAWSAEYAIGRLAHELGLER